jgi:hypothetical protein
MNKSGPAGGENGVIEVRLHDVNQLFDEMDPAPFHKRELNRNAEEYLVDSVTELASGKLREIVLYIERAHLIDDGVAIGAAIRDHFARRSAYTEKALRRLLQRGLISLLVGLSFLTAMFVIGQILERIMGEPAVPRILREGLLIIGWVAMWKPLEILLYDWWPILSERRLFDRLSRVQVRIVDDEAG